MHAKCVKCLNQYGITRIKDLIYAVHLYLIWDIKHEGVLNRITSSQMVKANTDITEFLD